MKFPHLSLMLVIIILAAYYLGRKFPNALSFIPVIGR